MKALTQRLADAAEKGKVEDIDFHLAAGADPNTPASDGLAPLLRAAINSHVQAVKILLRRGATVDCVHPESGKSALHLAAERGSVSLAKHLISAAAEIEKPDNSGSTPLQLAAGAKSGDMIRELIAAGARMDVAHPVSGNTVLHAAAFSGHPEVAEKLLRAGADLEARNLGGQSALHVAAREGRFGLVRFLVRSGADPAAEDVIGRTPLYVAAANGHTQVVMELVASGADPSTATVGGIAALTAAAEESKVLVMEALLQLGLPALGGRRAWADALCSSARKGLAEAMEKLLPAGGPGGLPGQKFLRRTGTSPLHCAAAGGHLRCVRMLLEAGADEAALNREQATPLEIVGVRREEGCENVELDDRIRRALIKAFLYRSWCWAWPVLAKPGPSGKSASGAVIATAVGSSKRRGKGSFMANLRVFRREKGEERPQQPAATFWNILRYAVKPGAYSTDNDDE